MARIAKQVRGIVRYAGIVVALVCIRLGVWQLDRLDQKRTLNQAITARIAEAPLRVDALTADSSGLLFRRVTLSGLYDNTRSIVIAGRSMRGAPGVYVLTPLRTRETVVLVNRGWIPASDGATVDLKRFREPPPESAAALILPMPDDPRAPRTDTASTFRTVWYHANGPALRRQFPYRIAPYVAQLLPIGDPGANPDRPVRLPPPALDEGPHLGYAFQWFGFAAVAIIGSLIIWAQKRKGGRGATLPHEPER